LRMSGRIGKVLFSSPSPWEVSADPVPANAMAATDTGAKGEEFRKALMQDILTELRGLATSLPDDAWKYEGEGAVVDSLGQPF